MEEWDLGIRVCGEGGGVDGGFVMGACVFFMMIGSVLVSDCIHTSFRFWNFEFRKKESVAV